MGFFATVGRGWEMAKLSMSVVRKDPELLVYMIIAGVGGAVALLFVVFYRARRQCKQAERPGRPPVHPAVEAAYSTRPPVQRAEPVPVPAVVAQPVVVPGVVVGQPVC